MKRRIKNFLVKGNWKFLEKSLKVKERRNKIPKFKFLFPKMYNRRFLLISTSYILIPFFSSLFYIIYI